MSTLAIVTGVILLLAVIALAVINFKIIPDLAKSNPDDIEGNLNKVVMYGKIYLALTVIILVCIVVLLILGITSLFSGGSQPKTADMTAPVVPSGVSGPNSKPGPSFLARYSSW